MKPSHDMPTCPRCAAPNGSTLDAQMTRHSAPIVQCAVCGHTWESVEDYERARVADAAWLSQEAKESAVVSKPTDYSKPQMRCPMCKAVVAITKRGTIAQHTRRVMDRRSYLSRSMRCPSSFQPAGNGYAEWLAEEGTNAANEVRRTEDVIADLTMRLETARGVLAKRVATAETIRTALARVAQGAQS